MDIFLYFAGVSLLVASILFSVFASNYAVIIFPMMFGLGCIVLGLAKIIELLEEIKVKNFKNTYEER
jgi:hypothetical protein